MPVLTERYLERDGDRLLLRLCVAGTAALDVLTDADRLTRARATLRSLAGGFASVPLGTFGPFTVTASIGHDGQAAIAVDGPELGRSFRGDQAMVLYLPKGELLDALRASR